MQLYLLSMKTVLFFDILLIRALSPLPASPYLHCPCRPAPVAVHWIHCRPAARARWRRSVSRTFTCSQAMRCPRITTSTTFIDVLRISSKVIQYRPSMRRLAPRSQLFPPPASAPAPPRCCDRGAWPAARLTSAVWAPCLCRPAPLCPHYHRQYRHTK